MTVQDIVNELTPGKCSHLQSLLLRPPFGQATRTFSPNDQLAAKLAGLVSIKGEDLMLQSVSEVPVKHHRLRTGIPGKLWRWKPVSGWKWKGDEEHINVLEARAVFTTLKWRVLQQKQINIRCVHLVDSLVVLHALTRGRSSSRKMRRTIMRINSYLLASGLRPIWGYINTKDNPADRPSCWGTRKRWVKKVSSHLGAASKESRKKIRKTLGTLKSLTVQPKTKERYKSSLSDFFSYLRQEQLVLPRKTDAMDGMVSDYLEHLWAEGEGRATASTFLAALQDHLPKLRHNLPASTGGS
jgi:hypothetical protein